MLPLYELLSHAELSRHKPVVMAAGETRGAERRARYGNLTLSPRVVRTRPLEPGEEEPRVIASLANVSRTGVGLLHSDELPAGVEFDVQWEHGENLRSLRFVVVHSRATSAGVYRTGARLVAGVLPEEAVGIDVSAGEMESRTKVLSFEENGEEESGSSLCSDTGVMEVEVNSGGSAIERSGPAPAGTFPILCAGGFEKIEKLDGVTTCGWERRIEMRRVGERMWIYIHSPGKKNGWGIFVDAEELGEAFGRMGTAGAAPFAQAA